MQKKRLQLASQSNDNFLNWATLHAQPTTILQQFIQRSRVDLGCLVKFTPLQNVFLNRAIHVIGVDFHITLYIAENQSIIMCVYYLYTVYQYTVTRTIIISWMCYVTFTFCTMTVTMTSL